MATLNIPILKSGWLQRQSDFLRRWKKQWCVLYRDGGFVYYTDDSKREQEGVILMQRDVRSILTGREVLDVDPPKGFDTGCLLEVKARNKEAVFCAESEDDARAWVLSLQEAKSFRQPPPTVIRQTVQTPPPFTTVHTYPRQTCVVPGRSYQLVYPAGRSSSTTTTYQTTYPSQAYQVAYPGQTYYAHYQDPNTTTTTTSVPVDGQTVVYVDRGYNRSGDLAMGALAGAAVGSALFWGPWW